MKKEYIDWCQKNDISLSEFILKYEMLTKTLKFEDVTNERDIKYSRIVLVDYFGTKYQICFDTGLLMKVDDYNRVYSLNPRYDPKHGDYSLDLLDAISQMGKLADYIMKVYKNSLFYRRR